MATNEFEKNVRKEMGEFKVQPSAEVWLKIEDRIREKKRKRRIIFFVLFSSIALMLAGYGIYNFSGNKTSSEAQHKLSKDNRLNGENKTNNSRNDEFNKKAITIKQNIPAENTEQARRTLIAGKQKQVAQSGKEEKHVTFIPKRNPDSQDQTIINIDKTERENYIKSDTTDKEITSFSSFDQHAVKTDASQKEIAKSVDKNLTLDDTTGSKLKESNDTRSVQAVNKKKGNNVPGKITWGINFSAGASVITEDVFSFKSSSANADMRFASSPGNSTGGGPLTGGGPVTYSRYPQSQNKPAFAFKAGINARKNISKRSSLSAGLGYSYLADKIKVGAAQGQTQSQSTFSLSYYAGSPQQTYTDHFHFIELPLSFNWRVTNNTDHFLSLNAGVSPSYLLATNALLYDTVAAGIYYHNQDLVTNAHFNFTSGISYQFKNKKSMDFSIGPQVSFDVSKVFKSDLDSRKYFLYTGIDARVFFEKKKK